VKGTISKFRGVEKVLTRDEAVAAYHHKADRIEDVMEVEWRQGRWIRRNKDPKNFSCGKPTLLNAYTLEGNLENLGQFSLIKPLKINQYYVKFFT